MAPQRGATRVAGFVNRAISFDRRRWNGSLGPLPEKGIVTFILDTPFPDTQRIGILVFKNFEPLDVWGFVEAFSIARFIGTSYGSAQKYPFEIVLISNELTPKSDKGPHAPNPIKSMNGPRVSPDLFRDDALNEKLDVLMIPGGQGVRDLLGAESRVG